MLFDSHSHLNDIKLINRIDEIIQNAKDNGVTKMLCVGFDYESSLLAIKLANQHNSIYAAIGIHPSEAKEFGIDLSWIEQHMSNPKVVAIGETGLDYYWENQFKEEQKELFINHIKLANKYHKPIVVHMRDATNDTYNVIKENKTKDTTGVMHCYSASVEVMKQFIDLNMYISLAGPVTFRNAKVPKEVAKEISLDNLLVETDSPYLSPMPFRGKTNEPKNVLYIAQEIADLKGVSLEEVQNKTFYNTCKLYNIDMKEVK
ncbi:TatD family hydrolase [Mycoplasmatota bacterium WC30]